MPKKKVGKIRKCSVCRKAGHDKRKCPTLLLQKKSPKNRAVLVKVSQKHRKSPHIVDLKHKKQEDVWANVKAFEEEKHVEPVRETADLASMVRKANQALVESKKCKVKSKQVKIPRRKVELPKLKFPKFHIPYSIFHIQKLPSKLRTYTNEKIESAQQSIRSKFSLKRFAYATLTIAILAVLPFPAIGYYNQVKDTSSRVVEASTNAFLALQSSTVAALQSNIPQAQYDLNLALEEFGAANSILEKEHQALQYVVSLLPVVGKQVTSRQHLLVAGHHLALGNTYLIKGIEASQEPNDLALTDRFEILANHLQSAVPQYEEALTELSAIDVRAVPTEYQQSFQEFKLLFAAFIDDMSDLVELSRSLNLVFGNQQQKRYLLVFQNNNELRPTGGFMGSFAVMDIQKGKILNLDIPGGGTYDLQGQLDKYVKPPLPLQLVNNRWEFQDANWFSDFSASAEKIAWFYEHGRGATADGVIAINATVLERLLKVLGPVQAEEYDLELSSENALEELQYEVEVDYYEDVRNAKTAKLRNSDEGNKPKAVFADLAKQFIARLSQPNPEQVVRMLTELHSALQQKEIQVYFTDKGIQRKFSEFGWTGELVENSENQDYLSVVVANLQGQKSDAKINQTIEHQSVVEEDGSVVNTVVIHREHTGLPGEMFYGAANIAYLRLYVPQGAELLEAGGFVYPPEEAFHVPEGWYEQDRDLLNYEKEAATHARTGTRITEEFGKTAFGNWSIVSPGEKTSVYFIYRLPFKVIKIRNTKDTKLRNTKISIDKWKQYLAGSQNKETSHYSLFVQKQSGINSNFSSRIIYPEGWTSVWKSNDSMSLALNGGEFETVLETDEVAGIVMERVVD